MKRTLISASLLLALAAPALADGSDPPPDGILDLLEPDLSLSPDLKSVLQYPHRPVTPAYPTGPARPRLRLFPGPKLLSVDVGLSWVPIVGGGAADDQKPHLASYRKFWDWANSWGLQANLHLHVLPTVDAYIGIGAVHHPSNGKKDRYVYDGPNVFHDRYSFSPLYIFPIEFGGKGYLKLKAPPGLRFLDPGRAAPMLYLKFGAGPAFVSRVDINLKGYINGSLQETLNNQVWWPAQSVLNIHICFGFEWGSFRTKKGVPIGLFAEIGYRYIGGPVVTHFTDISDPIQTLTLTIGAHFP